MNIKNTIIAVAALVTAFTLGVNAQGTATQVVSATASRPAPNFAEIDLGPDNGFVVEGGKVKVVQRQGDLTLLSPAVPSANIAQVVAGHTPATSVAAAPCAAGRAPAVLGGGATAAVAAAHPATPAAVACASTTVQAAHGCKPDVVGAIGTPAMNVVRAPFRILGGTADIIGGGGCNNKDLVSTVGEPLMDVGRAPFQMLWGTAGAIAGR